MHIYIFSGLGADERVFQRIDFSDCNVTFINWHIPEVNDTIETYANGFAKEITAPRPILIGLSFGGLVATEVAKLMDTEKVVLISSARTKFEIPFYFRWTGKLGLHKLIPEKLLLKANKLTYWIFGTESYSDKQLLKSVLDDTSPVFMKWAINEVVHWKNERQLNNIVKIHGTTDRIFPSFFSMSEYRIKNGGHFMIFNKADEISALLKKIL